MLQFEAAPRALFREFPRPILPTSAAGIRGPDPHLRKPPSVGIDRAPTPRFSNGGFRPLPRTQFHIGALICPTPSRAVQLEHAVEDRSVRPQDRTPHW